MTPAANPLHGLILFKLSKIIDNYMVAHEGGFVFTDNIDVYFPDGNIFKPDVTVITAENIKIIQWRGAIRGVPDMVVEVLSPSTRIKDLTVKKDIYESNGVKEYWIIEPWDKTVDVYILRDGKYILENSYHKYTPEELDVMTDEEKVAVKKEIKVSIFDDLFVNVDDIFSWGYDS
ncbi:MAG: Uma2 family endonuclease [Selenomonadaceae bacterium]|nr:Uma2 family endonuclease [Selenomonadaceae bacterium]